MLANIKTIAILIGALAIAVAVGWIYKKGGDSKMVTIERQNNAAASRADESVLDYDACRNAGRVWSFRTGKCLRSTPGNRN